MSYINTAININRILNHIDLIKDKIFLLKSSVAKNDTDLLNRAGHIELQLTDKCMLYCQNCHFRNKGDSEIHFNLLDYINSFIKPKAITIAGGGEPTIYPRFNDAIIKLSKNSDVKFGLITNGVFIPKGSWKEFISWARISLYTIENGKYAGRNALLYNQVIENIKWYICDSNIPNIGIHFLFYRKNISDIVPILKNI